MGLKSLEEAYCTKEAAARDWFRGYHCFTKKTEVFNRFSTGCPLSCFILDGDTSHVHIAYHDNDSAGHLTYATFKCAKTTMHIKESGVHFCKFVKTNEETKSRKADLNITDFALMLPYMHPKMQERYGFQMQFTLIYSDWEVLLCDQEVLKGQASLDESLFGNIFAHS